MDNQHKLIKGYRDLSQSEIDAMNRIKALAEQVGALVEELDASPNAETADQAADRRWVAIARTQLQQGFMALTRAIAKPTTF
mgnify:CR=1 FL=1